MVELKQFYAHSLPSRPQTEWEPLDVHLQRVSTLASSFADSFGGGAYARLAGLWHDLGKYSAEFQAYIRSSNDAEASSEQIRGKVDHSTAGAQRGARELKAPAIERVFGAELRDRVEAIRPCGARV